MQFLEHARLACGLSTFTHAVPSAWWAPSHLSRLRLSMKPSHSSPYHPVHPKKNPPSPFWPFYPSQTSVVAPGVSIAYAAARFVSHTK